MELINSNKNKLNRIKNKLNSKKNMHFSTNVKCNLYINEHCKE